MNKLSTIWCLPGVRIQAGCRAKTNAYEMLTECKSDCGWGYTEVTHENQSSLGVLTKNVEVKFKVQGFDERQEKDASGKVHWVRVQRKEWL